MNTWQILRQLQYLIRAQTWAGGVTTVFASGSVKITAAIPEETVEKLILPACLIGPRGATADPEFQDVPDYLEQEIVIRLIAGHAGDAFGEYTLVGGQRTGQTRSPGRGLLEVEEELFNAVELLNTDDGIVIQHRASSAVEPQLVEGQYIAMRDYLFRADVTADRYYHPVENLQSTDDVRNTPTPSPTPTPTPTP